uniref:Obscurin-like protein 1 n=1 Tax=Pelusios castaneus TaxID=367368 RepID=A0A8C8VLB6_9SAUR
SWHSAGDREEGAPRFLAYPHTSTVQSGADAVLKCQITGDPRPSIIWEKDKSPLKLLGRFHVQAEGDVYSLSISQVTPADSGQYVCKAKNAIGETYVAATLQVEVGELQPEGDPEDMLPSFLAKPLSLQVCRGEDVVFTCRVSGQPSPVLVWEKDGRKLSDLFESSHFSVGKEPKDWHFLKIFSTRPPDGGVYVCRARNRSGEALGAAVLLVDPMTHGPPAGPFLAWHNGELAPSAPKAKAFTVSEGKHAKFRCYVTGKPKPEIVWKKDGKVIAPDRRHLVYEDREGHFTLKVLYCRGRDKGLYICTASNTAGQTLSAVQLHVKEHRVRFQMQLEDVEVQECQDAVLECQVPLETIPTAWYLEDKPLQPSHKYLIEEQGLVRRLTIRDARADDDGIYLCEMQDKGRSIAEVSVRGMIVKRLPRKLDVMEGENAAFCVETQEAVEGICWSRNGLELRETSSIVLKSFGKTHLLVLVHVTREDAGVISFTVGESQTSAQLRIKCAKRVPPSAPVAAEMRTGRSNAALLAWCPGPDVHRGPPSSYILERQEARTAEWVQCLTTDLASMVEVLGDSVPAEADYRFRICAVNKYGRSRPVEFPGSVHLVPAASVRRALKDVQVQAGEDAQFSLELSASVLGQWILNGAKLEEKEEEEGQRCCIKCSGTEHSLLIRGVLLAESGAQVRFLASGVQESATLWVQEPPVRIVSSNEDAAHRYLAAERVVLACELSRADVPVQWYKDGVEVDEGESLILERQGPHHRLIIPSARLQDTGEFVCDAGGDSVFYNITVTEPPVRIVSSNEDAAHRYLAVERVVLACELSRADVPVQWYKDGVEVEEGESLILERQGPHRRLVIPSARPQDTGEFVCDAGGDSVFYNITVTGRWLWLLPRSLELQVLVLERVELRCELSRPEGQVRWFKDGLEVDETENLRLWAEGAQRCLTVLQARAEDAGEYICETTDEAVSFDVRVAEPPVKILQPWRAPPVLKALLGETVTLACELSRWNAPVQWVKDGTRLEADGSLILEEDGAQRRLVIPAAGVEHSGKYVCYAADDSRTFSVQVSAPPVRILGRDELQSDRRCQAAEDLELEVTLSHAHGEVKWYKDGEKLEETGRVRLEEDGLRRSLVILGLECKDAGEYLCDSRDDSLIFYVSVAGTAEPCSPTTGFPEWRAGEGPLLLACTVSWPSAAVRWLRDGRELVPSERVRMEAQGPIRRLTILGAQPSDAGSYVCDAGSDRMVTAVEVAGETAGWAGQRSEAGTLVTLVARLSQESAPVRWLKNEQPLHSGPRLILSSEGPARSLTIKQTELGDSGIFSCDSGADEVHFTLRVRGEPELQVKFIISELHNLTVLEGDDATYKCVVSPEDVALEWQLNGQAVVPGERLLVTRNGLCHALTIRQCQLADAATVTACAEGLVSTARLSVQEAQALFVRRLQDVVAEERQDVLLEVELNREVAEVQWMKQGVLIQPGSKYQLQEAGCRRSLTIRSLSPSDRGTYRCESLHDRTQAKLSVAPRKVSVRKPLLDVETFEKETATFQLELSHDDVPGVWTRDGIRVKPSRTCRISATGCVHSLTLLGLTLQDSGTVTFTADTLRSRARLTVREPPVTVVRAPRDVGVPETGAASFECELSRPIAEVKWYKDGTMLRVGPQCRIYAVGRRRLLHLSHCSLEDAGEYTCDAGDCQASATLRVHERQVQIVQELADVQVHENENAVFTCHVSHEDVKGEWFRNGEKIKVTSTVKIRQEGKHFLLICNVRPEDTGRIRFVAKAAASEASLQVEALPIRIVKPLRDKTVLVRHKATLECTVSQARGRVRWFRGDTEIFAGDKYEICNLDCYRTLIIHRVGLDDEGAYTCDAFDDRSTARLLVEGEEPGLVQGGDLAPGGEAQDASRWELWGRLSAP